MEATQSTKRFKDYMIDIETTGLNPGRHAMIQLSAVPFNLETQEVADTFFDSYLSIPEWRHFHTETLQWWMSKNRNVYEHICANQGSIVKALHDFASFVQTYTIDGVRPNFWMKRPFDWMFVESYYRDFEIKCPFHYQNVIEMTSYLKGTVLSDTTPVVEGLVKEGVAHNAYWDCKNQINLLFGAINQELKA